MRTGRNEPCPCGSGKKFKKCCQEAVEQALDDPFDTVQTRIDLTAYAEEHWPDELDQALAVLGEKRGRDAQDPTTLWLPDERALDWALHDRPLSDGSRVVDRYLAAEGRRLSPARRQYLEAKRTATTRLYEVERAGGGEVVIRDVLEGDRVLLTCGPGDRGPTPGEWVMMRVVIPRQGERVELEGPLPVLPGVREGLKAQLLERRDRFRKEHPSVSIHTFYREALPLMYEVVTRALEVEFPDDGHEDDDCPVCQLMRAGCRDPHQLHEAMVKAGGVMVSPLPEKGEGGVVTVVKMLKRLVSFA